MIFIVCVCSFSKNRGQKFVRCWQAGNWAIVFCIYSFVSFCEKICSTKNHLGVIVGYAINLLKFNGIFVCAESKASSQKFGT